MAARLRSVSPDATPEEIAAILAAIASLEPSVVSDDDGDDTLHEWVRAARLRSHRAGLQRGPWRLSGRIGRRSRA
jgi:hypothetical protein